MSMYDPCSVVRCASSSMRGFNTSSAQQAVRFGVAFAAPAPATASSAAWDANDEPLPDLLAGPTLRSVSSLVMSIDAEEGMSAAARNNNNNNNNDISTNKNSSNSNSTSGGGGGGGGGGAAKDAAVSGAMGSKMVDMFMTSLPPPPTPMDTNEQLIREQSFPPPYRTRLDRDQSFPPMDMLPSSSSSSLRPGWANSGGGGMVDPGIFGGGGGAGGAPSLSSSKFQGLGFQASLPWPEQEPAPAPGGENHRGSGNGGPSLGNNEGQHGRYYEPHAPSSSARPRHSSFDKLAEMIPGIPHWTTPSSSPSASSSLPSTAAPVEARDLHGGAASSSSSGSGSSSIITTTTKSEPAAAISPALTSRPTPPARGRLQHPSRTRPEKKMKKQHLRRADSSPPRTRWPPSTTSPPATSAAAAAVAAAAAAAAKRPPPTGTGKRSVEPPLSCGPVRPGGGPVDLAQQERRRVKIQRYLYKRSRRKFAKSTRDASPSRSRPKAAAKRPRFKGKFVKTVPDFISVNDRQPWEASGGDQQQQDAAAASPPSPPSLKSPAAGGVGVGFGVGGDGRRGGGGVRSVRNGGSINVNFNTRKAFSSTPPSSLLPRGGSGGGGARLPAPALALAPNDGAPNAFAW